MPHFAPADDLGPTISIYICARCGEWMDMRGEEKPHLVKVKRGPHAIYDGRRVCPDCYAVIVSES